MKKIYATCNLCQHFDPNRSTCKLNGERVNSMEYDIAADCQKSGRFTRDLNVIPDSYHIFPLGENIPRGWQPDFSRLPKDKNGDPLFVMTKRGYERAVPADPNVNLVSDMLVGVSPKILTYQGQREMIFDLGIEIALEEANKVGVKLSILPEEENWPGVPKLKQAYLQKQGRYRNPQNQWLSDEPIESWT